MADPFLKFYTSDWRSDPRLRMCSPAARGLWIELICLMHEARPYGQLRVHGQPPNEAQLASLTGIREAELPDLIAELERHGVFSRTREGVIYSRKLVRMEAKAATARKNGKLGGNPRLSNESEKSGSDNLPDKPPDKPHIPEAIFQNSFSPHSGQRSPQGFAEFWDAYPHRDGKRGRKPALAKYERVIRSGVPEQTLIDAARRYRTDKRVRDGFAKDPLTWLNQAGWEDEIAEASQPLDNTRRARWDKLAS